MDLDKASCASCGAPMDVPAGAQRITCAYCGTSFSVGRHGGQVTLDLAQRLDRLEAVMAERAVPAASAEREGSKDWRLAVGLCLLFGTFGLHRFYTGHLAIGIFQLVSVGGFGLWWLVDLVRMLLGGYRDAGGKTLAHYSPAAGRGLLAGVVAFAGTTAVLASAGVEPDWVVSLALVMGVLALGLVYAKARRSGPA